MSMPARAELPSVEARDSRPSPLVIGLVVLFIVESLASRTHVGFLLLSTPLHIVATAGLAGLVVALAVVRGLRSPPPSIALPLWLLIALAFLSSAYSPDFMAFNLIFATVWALHFLALWWALPSLLHGCDLDLELDLFLAMFIVVLVLSVLFVGPSRAGRYAGFFNTATQLGRIGALAVVCAFSEWVMGRRRHLWGAVLVAAMIMVLVSRTRASMGAMLIGCAVALVFYLFSPERLHRLRAGVAFFAVFVVAVTSFFMVDFGFLRIDAFLSYLRLSGGLSGVLAARQEIWMAGLERLSHAGWLGHGFSEKFGGFAAQKWGITYPTYDWTELVDPHNMLMTTAIQIGLPAMVVLAVVVAALGVELQRLPLRQRALGTAVYVSGLVFGLVDGNWFITFSPPDRISMALLALLVVSGGGDGDGEGRGGAREGPP